ncbi:alpha/beta hydrolase [Bacillus sp. A301a_S52]|nr:alpha/beta hydrolase [Bacillus sp. A301a_S52]
MNLSDFPNSQVMLSGTRQYEIVSHGNRHYRLLVSVPQTEPPPDGYPVIYALDGNAVFGTFFEAVTMQSKREEKTGVSPAVIVGIGYQTDHLFSSERFFDYTTGSPVMSKPDGGKWPPHGGAEQFLSFIDTELKPLIEGNYSINKKKQTLFGHSLGGLFVLYALLSSPYSFHYYVAGSPSIHWHPDKMIRLAHDFPNRLVNQHISAHVVIGLGEQERYHKSNIGDCAVNMYGILKPYERLGLTSEYVEFAGEGHGSVMLPLINRTIRYSYDPYKKTMSGAKDLSS